MIVFGCLRRVATGDEGSLHHPRANWLISPSGPPHHGSSITRGAIGREPSSDGRTSNTTTCVFAGELGLATRDASPCAHLTLLSSFGRLGDCGGSVEGSSVLTARRLFPSLTRKGPGVAYASRTHAPSLSHVLPSQADEQAEAQQRAALAAQQKLCERLLDVVQPIILALQARTTLRPLPPSLRCLDRSPTCFSVLCNARGAEAAAK